jgi:excinuclease ABC subunit A
VEHNLDIIRASDWVIDLGPEGGEEGGTVVYQGTVAGLKKCAGSYTGQSLNTSTLSPLSPCQSKR